MIQRNLTIVKRKLQAKWYKIKPNTNIFAFRLMVVLVLAFVISQKEFSFQFSIGGNNSATLYETTVQKKSPKVFKTKSGEKLQHTSMIPWWEDVRAKQEDITDELNLANAATAVGAALTPAQKTKAEQFSNLGFVMNPNYAKKHKIDPAIVKFKKQKCLNYIQLYLQTSKEEAEIYNIPVSITLAQGLLESNAGDSKLASRDNNHFGIKCKKKCIGCRCANYTDDSRYDMFRVFETSWFSFREHSKLLNGKRYKHLLKLQRSDYKNWAHGLQAAGYATDQRYAKKLIQIIEIFKLDQYDR